MKKSIIAAALAAAVMLAAAGCTAEEVTDNTTPPVSETESSTPTEEITEEITEEQPDSTQEETAAPIIKAGAWYSYVDDEMVSYYVFNEDGSSGNYTSASVGIGVGFAYEQDGDRTIFHMGAVDNDSPATVTSDGDTATIKWDTGLEETLIYVSEATDDFTFYTDEELSTMALNYYASISGEDTSELQAAVGCNPDGTATIQLYSNLGDHNSTADWYVVDRITAVGENVTGDAIDLKG